MVVFDATMLMLFLRPTAGRPVDSHGNAVEQVEERISALVKRLERTKTRIIVPTPALSEVLVHAGNAGPEIVETLTRSTVFKVEPFETRAAVELALMTRHAVKEGDKRSGLDAPWAKVKFDRQIIAIAKVYNVTMIYSDDSDVRALATAENLLVTSVAELPLPNPKDQMEMPFEKPTITDPTDEAPDLFEETRRRDIAEAQGQPDQSD